MCSDITGVISLFELLLGVLNWPRVHGNQAVISTGLHKNSSGDFGWGIANPLAHVGTVTYLSPTFQFS